MFVVNRNWNGNGLNRTQLTGVNRTPVKAEGHDSTKRKTLKLNFMRRKVCTGSRSTLRHLWFTASKNQSGSSNQCAPRPSSVDLLPSAAPACSVIFRLRTLCERTGWSSWSCAYADQAAQPDPAACFGMKLNLNSRLNLITLGDFNFHLDKTSFHSSAVLLATQDWSFI